MFNFLDNILKYNIKRNKNSKKNISLPYNIKVDFTYLNPNNQYIEKLTKSIVKYAYKLIQLF
ncbi:MAG: hypothetical protein COZ66_01915 [Candidatus Huberarchaeum crystalense]|uniref:Uncharacterized protein n=1 Tax=Huberarchaeum crystalense TaxID=2014257 RepID=A0A2H9N266_HUBC1|nr:MAG: hypothetical protein COZ66_01915 [Candidatus Huberarchaeum crystalense]